MEAIGAIASILQIAQTGAQLSLTLYKIAETVRSANNDLRFVAKDIALFSDVLRQLGIAFENGQKSRLYRKDAYQTSLQVVKECKDVFREIQNTLRKSTRDGVALHDKVSLPRVEKFLWVFRRPRVQVLRGRLECLKSTISLQLAVLNYTDKVSTSSASDNFSAAELLSLKSLVLANEAAKDEFQALLRSTIQDSSSDSGHETATQRQKVFTANTDTVRRDPTTANHGSLSSSVLQPDHGFRKAQSIDQLSSIPRAPTSSSISVNKSEVMRVCAQSWSFVDRLELALRKVETARWEQERIHYNIKSRPKGKGATTRLPREADLLHRLKGDLFRFGLSEMRVDRAIFSLKRLEAGIGTRTEIKHLVSRNDHGLEILRSLGMDWESNEGQPGCWMIKRWMPEFLDDILWSHVYRSLVTLLKPASENSADPVIPLLIPIPEGLHVQERPRQYQIPAGGESAVVTPQQCDYAYCSTAPSYIGTAPRVAAQMPSGHLDRRPGDPTVFAGYSPQVSYGSFPSYPGSGFTHRYYETSRLDQRTALPSQTRKWFETAPDATTRTLHEILRKWTFLDV